MTDQEDLDNTFKGAKGYSDLADLEEDQRIDIIGKTATGGKVVAFVVDDWPGKADRYIRKLSQRYPEVEVLWRGKGPVPKSTTVKVGPRRKDDGHH